MSEQLSRPSKYRVAPFAEGFSIEAPDRNRVKVQLRATHFHVSDGCLETGFPRRNVGLFEFRSLLDLVAEGLMRDWVPPDHDRKPWPGIKHWAVGKTRQAICRLVQPQWRRLLDRTDNEIVDVQKKIFAATFGCAEITLNPDFYHDRYLVQDVLKYRAAAVAVRHAEELTQIKQLNQRSWLNHKAPDASETSKSAGHLKLCPRVRRLCELTQMKYLQNWLDLFSPGPAYTSLRRTLMNLPGGVSSRLLTSFPRIRLERPVFRRLELLVLLLASGHSETINQRLFQFANESRIRVAMEIVSRSVGRRPRFRSTQDVAWFVDRVARYPERHDGNIVGLAEKAVRWERDRNAAKLKDLIAEYGRDSWVHHPPIDFPKASEIRFLATPGDICAEGIRMNHCIEMMIPDALEGRAYIFHAEKFGCQATILVDGEGRYCQSAGPFNQSNLASQWAIRVLRRWSRGIRAQASDL